MTPKEIEIKEVRVQIACMLNELWHSRLPKIHWSNVVRNTHYVCYALSYKQAVIGVGMPQTGLKQGKLNFLIGIQNLAKGIQYNPTPIK